MWVSFAGRGLQMIFRYFDAEGRQLTVEQLNAMSLQTPAMHHVFVTVLERVEKYGKVQGRIEKEPPH